MGGDSERIRLRRLNYLDCATIPTRLMDRKIFPRVHAALVKGVNDPAGGKADFVEICDEVQIPKGMFVDKLWLTFMMVHSNMADLPGWIPG